MIFPMITLWWFGGGADDCDCDDDDEYDHAGALFYNTITYISSNRLNYIKCKIMQCAKWFKMGHLICNNAMFIVTAI